MYFAEYQWNILCADNPDAKCVSVMDMEGVGFSTVFGDTMGLVQKLMSVANHHYPERSHMIFIINIPGWFSMVFKAFKGFVHENTLKKTKILAKHEVFDGLKEFIDIDQVTAD